MMAEISHKIMMYKFNELNWRQVLAGYEAGVFPMGNDDGSVSWYEANPRGIISIGAGNSSLQIPRSLRQALRKEEFEIRHNTCFRQVIENCADREFTWINELIINAYTELNAYGYGHSVEAWKNGELAGGLYGIAYKSAFFGESMFHNKSNASKVCVVKLLDTLVKNEYTLLDIQMMTPHFRKFGAIEISAADYLEILEMALESERQFIF